MRGRLVLLLLLPVLLSLPSPGSRAETVEDGFVPPEGLEDGWYARIETSMGRIVVQLLPGQAPQSVAYFVGLARGDLEWNDPVSGETHKEPFYDNTPIYKSEAGLRFDAGDPTGSGRGAPLLFVPLDGQGPVNFHYGYRLGHAREAGSKVSAVKFFITASAAPWFTGKNPCFGRVVSGKETVFDLTQVRTYSNLRPIEPLTIEKIRIFTVGQVPELEEPVPHQPMLRSLDRAKGPRKNR